MKKVLLLGAMVLSASCMMAQDDVTPAGYHYWKSNQDLVIHPLGWQGANINNVNPVWSSIQGDQYYDNGLIVLGGGQYANTAQPYYTNLKSAMSIVNLGGEVGKCLAICGPNSKINDVLKDLYGADAPTVAVSPGAFNWFNINWFSNPNNTPTMSAAKRIRVRVTMNMYSSALDETNVINNEYMVTDQGGARPEQATATAANGKEIKLNEFIKVDDAGIPVTDDDFNSVWDPERWLVFEFDANCPDPEKESGLTFGPLRLKVEFNEGGISNGTLFIRDIEFIADNEDVVNGERFRSYVKMTPNPGQPSTPTTGVDEIIANDAEKVYFNLQGVRVANPTEGLYIVKQGNKISKQLVR